MSRVIHLENAAKDRTALTRSIVWAIRELGQSSGDGERSRDLVAYIILALDQIFSSIDSSVEAWEKRGYWVKADRFRMEWSWTKTKSDALEKALFEEDWDRIIQQVLQITQKLSLVKLPVRKPAMEPWNGAYKLLIAQNGGNPLK